MLPEKNQVTKLSEPLINEDWGWSEDVGFHTWGVVAVFCLFVFWPNEATAFQPRSQLFYFIATQDSAEASYLLFD